MPTPVQHLVIANAILAKSSLPERARAFLNAQRAEFLFGNVAPDVQTVSGQPRAATHFFNVPLDSSRPAHEVMFEAHTYLSEPGRLPAAQAAFLAGYVVHLLLDVMWVRDIFQPIFGPDAGWSTFHDRLFLHNVLRAWCDRRDQAGLAGNAGASLAAVTPKRWLPFTGDRYLRQWRDALVEQLTPGATIRTVQVFAERGRIDPLAFERVLESEDELNDRIFSHAPHRVIDDFYAWGLSESCALLDDYLARV